MKSHIQGAGNTKLHDTLSNIQETTGSYSDFKVPARN